jgi:hypothetical protein
MSNSGLSAAIQMAAQLSLDFPEMEVLSIGRSATSDAAVGFSTMSCYVARLDWPLP